MFVVSLLFLVDEIIIHCFIHFFILCPPFFRFHYCICPRLDPSLLPLHTLYPIKIHFALEIFSLHLVHHLSSPPTHPGSISVCSLSSTLFGVCVCVCCTTPSYNNNSRWQKSSSSTHFSFFLCNQPQRPTRTKSRDFHWRTWVRWAINYDFLRIGKRPVSPHKRNLLLINSRRTKFNPFNEPKASRSDQYVSARDLE